MKQSLLKHALLLILAIMFAIAPAQAQNLVVGGNMEDESAWNATYFSADFQPDYEFNYTADSLRFGRGGKLNILQGEANGQLLLWQRITLEAGKTYRATAAIAARDYFPGPSGGGAWYQLYIDPEEVDETATDYNPGELKLFNMDGWQVDFPDIFDGMWESVSLGGGIASAPYYIAPGAPGEQVEVTFGIKFGQWWADYAGTAFELLVDEVYLWDIAHGEMTAIAFDENPMVPCEFSLQQNYPNPFNPTTTIGYSIPAASNVRLSVFDILGKEVGTLVDENKSAGRHSAKFDASDLSNGIYFYRLDAGELTLTNKLTLLK